MSFIIVIACIALLLALILLKINPLLALLTVSVITGLALGISPTMVMKSIQTGVGDTMGSLAVIIGLGAMFGKMIEVSGAAKQISDTLIQKFGKDRLPWAMSLTGMVVGIPLYYNAGFIILVPLMFSVARASQVPLLWVAIPTAASLSVTHGFLPPHPGPTAIAGILHADIGKTLLYGFIIAIPAMIIAGPLFARFVKKINTGEIPGATEAAISGPLPSIFMSFGLAIFPVAVIAITTVFKTFLGWKHPYIDLVSEPSFALLVSVFLACYFLGWKRGLNTKQIMNHVVDSISGIAMIVMIIAAGGGFKQVLIDSGMADRVAAYASGLDVSPLILVWLVAALVRVSIGSATIAGLTAGGIVSSMATGDGINPEMMVLSVGAGSLMFSHVNDSGFWMFKEYFNLSLKQTFLSWSLMETIVSVVGLIGVLILNSVLFG